MTTRYRGLALLLLGCLINPVLSDTGETYFTTTKDGIALDGYDPVSYFVAGAAVRGNAEYVLSWEGAEWYFDSEQHLARFAAEPLRYAPQYGGWCAMAMVSGRVVEVDFENAWTVDDGKLYFNVNASVRQRWLRGLNRNLKKANRQWPEARQKIEEGEITVFRREWLPENY